MGTTVIYRANIKETNQPKPAAAFGRLQRKYEALDKDELIVVNGEVTSFVSTASAAAVRMAEISAEILQLPGYGPEDISDLQDAADGLDLAEGEYRATLKTMNELTDCGQEITQTREKFVADPAQRRLSRRARGGVSEGVHRRAPASTPRSTTSA